MAEKRIQKQVRHFYDEVGWQKVENNCYQNTQFEDLRSVSSEYIHHCHLWVNRFLKATRKFIYKLEDRFPHYLGENGAYPLIVFEKQAAIN